MIFSNDSLFNYGLNSSNICPIWMNVEIGLKIINILNKNPTIVFKQDAMESIRWINYKETLLEII